MRLGGRVGLQQVEEVTAEKQVDVEQAQDLLARQPGRRSELEVGDHQRHAQGDPDLREHSVSGGAVEAFELEVLLQELEEQLDLPTALIDGGNGAGSQVPDVGQELVALAGLGAVEGDKAQLGHASLDGFRASEANDLVADDAVAGARIERLDVLIGRVGPTPGDEVNAVTTKTYEPRELAVTAIDHDDGALRQRQLPGNRRLPHAAVGDDRERGDEAVVIEPHVQLHGPLAERILR